MSWTLQFGARMPIGTFLCSPYNLANNREVVLAGGGSLLLLVESLNFRTIKIRTHSKSKAKH